MMTWERGWNVLKNIFASKDLKIGFTIRFKKTGIKMPKHSEINWTKLIMLGKKLVGKPYIFGAEVHLKDPNPDHISAIDCSELIEFLYAQVGISVPDGSYNQFKVSRPIKGDPMIGDLGFKANPENGVIHHVGIWIDEAVLEAKGKAWGVVLTPLDVYEKSSHFVGWRRLNSIADA